MSGVDIKNLNFQRKIFYAYGKIVWKNRMIV